MNKTPRTCCSTTKAYIETHLDPNATLTRDDDPTEVVAALDRVFHAEGGAGVTVEEMAEYLDTLE